MAALYRQQRVVKLLFEEEDKNNKVYINKSSINDMIMLEKEKLKLKAKFFRGFADPTRLAILESLRNGEKTVTEIVQETGQSQSNISNHLSCLLECGLLKNRRDGKNIYYSIRNAKVEKLLENSDIVLSEVYREIFECTRYEE